MIVTMLDDDWQLVAEGRCAFVIPTAVDPAAYLAQSYVQRQLRAAPMLERFQLGVTDLHMRHDTVCPLLTGRGLCNCAVEVTVQINGALFHVGEDGELRAS